MKRLFQNISRRFGAVSYKRSIGLASLSLAVVLVTVLSAQLEVSQEKNPASVEVGFSSFSPNGVMGGEIIPASCESGGWDHVQGAALVETGTNGGPLRPGYRLRAGDYGNYCFGNNGTATYWIPTKTWAEFIRFWNIIPSLPGVYIIP